MKKIVSALLLAAALFITSCSASAPELLAFIDDSSSGAVDYGGVKIVISSHANSMNEDETYWSDLLGFDTNTMYGEALLERVAEVEKNLGVKIEYHTDPGEEDGVAMKLMAGTFVADIVNYIAFGAMQNFAQGGMLMPMTGFDHIDLSETWKYGSANVLEGGMVNSVPYSVQPVAWPKHEPTGISSLLFNMDLIKENAFTDPHEFWENENWYWDTFEETYLAVPNNLGDDEWVISASEKIIWYGFAYSNDVQYVYANENGEYAVNAKPQALIEALQEGTDWYRDYRDKVKLYSDYWTIDDYNNGLAVFTVTGAGNAIGGGDIVSGIMPFPCGPSAEYGTWCQAFDRIEGFGIPINSNEPDVAAHVISELFEPLDEYLGMSMEEYYKEMMFNTEIDAEIYMELIKDVRYDYTFAGGSDLMRGVNNSFSGAIVTGKAANEVADTYAGQVMSIMSQHALPNYDYMYKHFYSLENAD